MAAPRKIPALKIVEPAVPDVLDLPETLVIGPYDYTVREIPELERIKSGYMGQCDEGNLVISIAVDEVTPQHQAETLIHEVLHGLLGAGTVGEDDGPMEEERLVTVLTKGIMQFVRDNPHALAWINQQYPVVRT